MLATAPTTSTPAASAKHQAAASPDTRHTGTTALEQQCPYCRAGLPPGAKKCSGCGEWVVRTSAGPSAALLRLLGWCWGGVALVAGASAWYAGTAARAWVVARSVETPVPILVLDLAVYALVALVVLQGVTVAVGVGALANVMPRRPRWWS